MRDRACFGAFATRIVLSLLFVIGVCEASTTASKAVAASQTAFLSSSIVKLDLSYLSHISATKLVDTLQEAAAQDVWSKSDIIDLNLDGSYLCDKGIIRLAKGVFLQKACFKNAVGLYLSAKFNSLTVSGAASLINALVVLQGNNNVQKLSNNNKGTKEFALETEEIASKSSRLPLFRLDLSWNDLSTNSGSSNTKQNGSHDDSKVFHKALRNLLAESPCLSLLCLESCGLTPAAGRALGKGLLQRFYNTANTSHENNLNNTNNDSSIHDRETGLAAISISLCGNTALGDAGIAALAAAVLRLPTNATNVIDTTTDNFIDKTSTITPDFAIETLDLSQCGVGDAGARVWAQALSSVPYGAVQRLDLSNNPKISHVGAKELALALVENVHNKNKNKGSDNVSTTQSNNVFVLECLDLSNNHNIGDKGAAAFAEVLEKERVQQLVLRSCEIHADGAAAIGKALRKWAQTKRRLPGYDNRLYVDLSGNPLGILRGKSKIDSKGLYSASRFKSKASATAANYFNMFSKNIKDAVGLSASSINGESDDEPDNDGMGNELMGDESEAANTRCGAKSLANAFLESLPSSIHVRKKARRNADCTIFLGLRRCFLDHGAADALAAVKVAARDHFGVNLRLSIDMNPVLEDDVVSALHGDSESDLIREMAERYNDALEALQEARVRAAEAARAAKARIRAEAEIESSWKTRQKSGRRYRNEYEEFSNDDDDNPGLRPDEYDDDESD